MITFHQLFQDPDAKQLIYHITNNIDGGEGRVYFVDDLKESERIPLLILSKPGNKISRFELETTLRDKGFLLQRDYLTITDKSDNISRVYIFNPEIIVDSDLVEILKRIAK